MNIRRIEIGEGGYPVETLQLSDEAKWVCEATANLYRVNGFVRPWIGYFAAVDKEVVGTCAFKSPPQNGRVEIAYFTFPAFERRGIATEMARSLIAIAQAQDTSLQIIAQTMPQENASTAILKKLGFTKTGTVCHPEDGEVWEWLLDSNCTD